MSHGVRAGEARTNGGRLSRRIALTNENRPATRRGRPREERGPRRGRAIVISQKELRALTPGRSPEPRDLFGRLKPPPTLYRPSVPLGAAFAGVADVCVAAESW